MVNIYHNFSVLGSIIGCYIGSKILEIIFGWIRKKEKDGNLSKDNM